MRLHHILGAGARENDIVEAFVDRGQKVEDSVSLEKNKKNIREGRELKHKRKCGRGGGGILRPPARTRLELAREDRIGLDEIIQNNHLVPGEHIRDSQAQPAQGGSGGGVEGGRTHLFLWEKATKDAARLAPAARTTRGGWAPPRQPLSAHRRQREDAWVCRKAMAEGGAPIRGAGSISIKPRKHTSGGGRRHISPKGSSGEGDRAEDTLGNDNTPQVPGDGSQRLLRIINGPRPVHLPAGGDALKTGVKKSTQEDEGRVRRTTAALQEVADHAR